MNRTTLKCTLFLAGLSIVPLAIAQQRLHEVNSETPEGQLIQQIGQEADLTKKIALMEDFAAKYPKHDGAGWVNYQLQLAAIKANQPDTVLKAGEAVLAIDPNDMEAAHQNLKAAEMKNDPALIQKWSDETSKRAKAMAAAAKPADVEEADWKSRVDYAKQVDTYTEYALYAGALKTSDPNQKIALGQALLQRNPDSEYAGKAGEAEFNGYRMLNEKDKAAAAAERAIVKEPNSEDMLIFLADYSMQNKKPADKVIEYSQKTIDVLASKPKPEGVSDADWDTKKTTLSGLAHFMIGTTQLNGKKLKDADKSLREALPLVASNEQLKAATLFYLGLANYQMKNTKDAVAFSQECARIKSPFQAKAQANLKAMGAR